jgi:3',5'-cyclic AMP phosphodiesterase CpdA
MRTIVQISDLHFGATLFTTVEPLLDIIREVSPDLIIVSGDLTQRARVAQFRDARAFLDRLPARHLVIPGNHDVPLYDVVRRFVAPLQRYRQFITEDLAPSFIDDEIAVVGINSARSLVFKGGEIDTAQLDRAEAQFSKATRGQVRIVTVHHPFHIPAHIHNIRPVEGAQAAMERFAKLDVSLILAGHMHMIHESSASSYVPDYHATVLHAGTATSTRSRGEPNSFFVIRVDDDIAIDTFKWDVGRNLFESSGTRVLQPVRGARDGAGDHVPQRSSAVGP